MLYVCDVRLCLCQDSLTYFGDLLLRIAPKFGTHVRIDTLTFKKIDPPHPRGFRGLYIVNNLSRRTVPKFGTHVRIDTLTLIFFKFDPPHPRGVRGLSIVKNLLRRTAPKFDTHVLIDTLTLKKKKKNNFHVSYRRRMSATLNWPQQSTGGACQSSEMAAVLNSLSYVFKNLFLPKSV